MEKEAVETTFKYFCYKYTYINAIVFLLTLCQYQGAPLALPLFCMILNEIVIWIKFSNGQIVDKLDHILHILFYMYVTLMYYLNLKSYIFSNIFIVLSFILKVACDKQYNEQHDYSTIIRLVFLFNIQSIIFYRFSLLIAILCITLKVKGSVDWTWSQTFWWYWMFLSGLIGTTMTFLLILINKLIKIKCNFRVNQTKNEVKLLIWLLYIGTLSSVIAGIWIVNTLNELGIGFNIQIGDVSIYIIIPLNILIFCTISYLLFDSVVEQVLTINQIQTRHSNTKSNSQEKEKQNKKVLIKQSIFMQKLSNAYFRKIKTLEILQLKEAGQNQILTERNMNKNIIKKNKPAHHNSNNKCIICCEQASNAVFMNCGHGGICYQCAVQVAQNQKECFLCRQIILQIYEIDEKDASIFKRVISKTRISN
ncbi:unnamed protein product (macronuclear) [Paramecium tetraurelia]|uniref:RING-type domain-containing protein n=1 Tax=Paramecium tetraurelia TaxID=5888 RepID=A0E0W7_PARTE|nr:uncharacterized protein GSPATT00022102001 [Paramecium tetraurelia]CAK88934.1 unnamed protein product [Paramecium tetraurelia]|eukprot:XP_001456331.1 hypothetical protein (macronuclear) [Paramecium tetraurelia strain d4-2]